MYKKGLPALKGFTLVELLVVIAIIGILASIVMANLGTAKVSSRDARRIADLKNIQLALALYYNDNNKYPNNIYGGGGLSPVYMSVVPNDPKDNSTGYSYSALVAATTCGINACANPARYHLGAVLEQGTEGTGNLAQDSDIGANPNIGGQQYCYCSGSNPDFNGLGAVDTSGWVCSTSGGGPTTCYDVVNN